MVQAAARGVVDFTQARPLDRRWYRKLFWLLDQVEEDNLRAIFLSRQGRDQALLARAQTTETAQACLERLEQNQQLFRDHLFLYLQTAGSSTDTSTIQRLRQQWQEHFGDPNDPEVQKKIQQTVDVLRSRGSQKRSSQPDTKPATVASRVKKKKKRKE